MAVFDFIDPYFFLISLSIGLLYAYFTVEEREIIIKYPTPFNAGKINYIDENGTCFRYAIEKTTCPIDKTIINNIKLQN